MEFLNNFPIIPILTLLFILGFFSYQLRNYVREQKKHKTPSLPKLNFTALKDTSKVFLTKIENIQNKPKPKSTNLIKAKNIALLALGVLFIVTTTTTFLILRNKKLSYVPRANLEPTLISIVTPTIIPTEPITPLPTSNQSTTVAISPSPTQTLLAQMGATTTPSPTRTGSVLNPTTTPISSLTPTSTKIPTPTRTLLAQGTITPTSSLISSLSNMPSPTTASNTKLLATPTTGAKEIPQAGVNYFSLILLLTSVILLTLGFVI